MLNETFSVIFIHRVSAVEVIGCTCKTNVSFTYGSCDLSTWRHLVRDNVCHDITNNEECLYDGGDCCRPVAYRGLPGCIECQCKTGRIEPQNGLEPNKTYRTWDWRWGVSEYRPPDQRLKMQQVPERRLNWIYKYEDYPELADGNEDYDDVVVNMRTSQYNNSRLSNPIAKAHTGAQVRRNVNYF